MLMKRGFSTEINTTALSFWLLIARLLIGVLMLTHGIPKLQQLMAGNVQFPDPLHVGATASLALTVFAEFVCSILLILGLGTRLAAVPLLIVMLVAILSIHAGDELGKKELPILYAALYFGFLNVGAGKYSIDHLIGKNKGR